MYKTVTVILAIVILSWWAGLTLGTDPPPPAHTDYPVGAHASWTPTSQSIKAQFSEADVVIRTRIQTIDETRALVQSLPVSGKPADDFSDQVVPTGEYVVSAMPFTDARAEVLEVYKGPVAIGDVLPLMQTGGYLPATADYREQFRQLSEDPLFEVGTEHFLFLLDISGDEIHAPDRELYIINTPLGRYDIQGEAVINHSQYISAFKLPTTVEALLARLPQQQP